MIFSVKSNQRHGLQCLEQHDICHTRFPGILNRPKKMLQIFSLYKLSFLEMTADLAFSLGIQSPYAL